MTTKKVLIIAPNPTVKDKPNIDFYLRFSRNNAELTLARFYDLAKNNYDVNKVRWGFSYYRDTIPAAGYYLSGLLRQNGYDTIMTSEFDEESLRKAASEDPFAVCISSTMIFNNETLRLITSEVRRLLPDAFIIIGGIYVWKGYHLHNMWNEIPDADRAARQSVFHPNNHETEADAFVVSSHGSRPLLMILKELLRGGKASLEDIPNLAFPDKKGGFSFTARKDEEVDYDVDYTRWDLIDELPALLPIRTSIGCPYRCRFCDFYRLYPKMLLRSRDSLTSEIQLIQGRSGKKPSVYVATDDNVFINSKRVDEVCDTFMKAGVRSWIGELRASSVTPENVGVIKDSGLLLAICGIESGDAAQIERINKAQKLEKVKRGIELLDDNGVSSTISFIVGYPGESMETIANTADFINNLSVTNTTLSYDLYPLYISPLSELTKPEFRDKWRIKGVMDSWSHYTMSSDDVMTYAYELFKRVEHVSFHYWEENKIFNKVMFTDEQKKNLFNLRRELTCQLLENSPWSEMNSTFENISKTMGLAPKPVDEKFRDELTVPDINVLD